MPLFYQQNINETTSLAIWKIEESEDFFLEKVTLQRNITHPNKRLQHLAGRFLLPLLFPDFPNEDILIADTRKPYLFNEQYHFSISHCGNYAAALVSSNKRTGIDIEYVTPRLLTISKKFLHADEMRFVNSQLQSERLSLLSILWSAKEAIYKWYGNGEVDFREMMRTFPFQLEEEGRLNAVFMKTDTQQNLLLHYKCIGELTLVYVIS